MRRVADLCPLRTERHAILWLLMVLTLTWPTLANARQKQRPVLQGPKNVSVIAPDDFQSTLDAVRVQANRADALAAQNNQKLALLTRTEAMARLNRHVQRWLGQGTQAELATLLQYQAEQLSVTVSLHLQRNPSDKGAARLAWEAVLWRKGLALDVAAGARTWQVPTLGAVQAALPTGAALLEFVRYVPTSADGVVAAPRYAGYVLRPTGLAVGVDLGDAATLESAIAEFRAALLSPTREDARAYSAALSALLLAPLRPYLHDAAHWLIAPDAALTLVPFAALSEPDGRWVLEKRTVTLVNSGRELVRPRGPPPPWADAWVIADPDLEQSADKPAQVELPRASTAADFVALHFAPMQGAAEEADAIAPLLRARSLLGTRATESAMRLLHAPRILHVAVPAFFLPTVPTTPESAESVLLRSGLALAGFHTGRSGTDDGVLTALDVLPLHLQGTQLIVLSGCNSADIAAGPSVRGLRRAFAIAGAESVVMNLWCADNQATRALLTSFYGKLSGGEGRSEALRRAQLELLAQGRTKKPFYWAAFQVAGDWRPLR